MLNRYLYKQISDRFFKGKVVIVLGARQVGKTTLVQMMLENRTEKVLTLSGDEADATDWLSNTTTTKLNVLIGKNRIVFIDEAQRIPGIGLTLKLLADNFSDVQVIATGSSSFDLFNKIQEPLTGRKYEFSLFPMSYSELVENHGMMEESRLVEQRLVYGSYPEIVTHTGEERELLTLLSGSYLYKDLLMLEQIKKPVLLEKILRALALQVGQEVSYAEIGRLVGANLTTVEKYIDLLEKSFVIYRLHAFSRNVRNEIRKGRKIYFYDNGIRNAIISNFNMPSQRTDTGALWENYLISERMKNLSYKGLFAGRYFWRTTQQQEVDYIEDADGRLSAFEFKWSARKKARMPATFTRAYPECKTKIITRDNYIDFVGGGD